jgi:nanoRNase/pAp phosphatase (c-di-AMP/oligoRNAs hydrolase)
MARRCADCGVNGKSSLHTYSDRFLAELADATSVTFVSHVQPDPDSIGSMMGLAHLVDVKLHKPVLLTRDGRIRRVENQALVDSLDIDLEPIEDHTWRPSEALVMVDSQPNTGRHSFDPDIPITAVIDHHNTPGDVRGIPFVDVRREVGATCSIVTSYLIEQHVPVSPQLATVLYYGIETELGGFPREASPLDDDALHYLFPKIDKDILAQIRNARQPQEYFECLLHGLQNSFIYDDLIVSYVSDLPQPELAAEVVDFLIRYRDIHWAVCLGVHKDQLIISMRSALDNAHAGEILRRAVGKLGKAGGHERRAGGCIPLASRSGNALEQLHTKVRRRLLRALKIDECRGHRLVPRREMLQSISH